MPAQITVQQLQSNPELARLWNFATGGGRTAPSSTAVNPYAWAEALKKAGIPVPSGAMPQVTPDGIYFTESNQNIFGPGFGGPMQVPQAPTSSGAQTLASMSIPTVGFEGLGPAQSPFAGHDAGSRTPSITNTLIDAGTKIATNPSTWSRILSSPTAVSAIGAGANIAGQLIAANAQGNASEVAAKAAEEALAWEKAQYAKRREDLAPYAASGAAANATLSNLLGLPAPPPSAPGQAAPAPSAPPPAQGSAAASSAPAAGAKLVTIIAPTGEQMQVPEGPLVEKMIAAGARRAA